jgi:signal transduction histidine kinase
MIMDNNEALLEQTGRILVVDDEETIINLFRDVLNGTGFDVFGATSEEEALKLYREKIFDLALTDIFLNGRNGIELLKEMKKIQPETPVVVMSGNPTLKLAVCALRAGAYDFLIKPVDINLLSEIAVNGTKYKRELIREIIEKKRLEYIAESANLMENIGFVFSGVRHELGNPINAIKMALSILKENIDSFDKERILEFVDRSLNDIGRVEYLLRSLKNFSMFENSSPEYVDIRSFMEKFNKLISGDLERRNIRYKEVIGKECDKVYIDPVLLQQVLLNLITNAVAAVKNIDKDPKIIISINREKGNVKIVVRDNGCGIKEEDKKHLFQPFFSTKTEGTGLGLVIVRKMIILAKGTIDIKSKEGEGTSVILIIPDRAGEKNG